jgi:hypothetical protein
MFCTAKGAAATSTAVIEDEIMDGSIEDLFMRLKHRRMLSDKDGSAKVPRITLRIYVYDRVCNHLTMFCCESLMLW